MKQWIKFIIVGSSAALIHLSVLHLLVSFQVLSPIYANVLAFFTAFLISYLGQSLWSFNHRSHQHRLALLRFLLVQLLCSFALNQVFYTLLLTLTSLNYLIASLLVLMIIPIITFTLSKYWAFR